MYCKKCGGKLETYASNCAFCGEPVEKYNTKANYVKEAKVVEKKEMTTAKWFLLFFVALVPVLGWLVYLIVLFKWAFSKNATPLIKSFAKASLLIIFILLAVIATFAILNLDQTKDLVLQLLDKVKNLF